MSYKVTFKAIKINGKKQRLQNPIIAKATQDNDTEWWTIKNTEYHIIVSSKNLDDALDNFLDYVEFLYHEYVTGNTGELTDSGRKMRNALLRDIGLQ